jgi:lipoyl-dependent peroxiredoxin subunit D
MSLADLKSQLPDFAKDLRLNLESVLTEGGAPGLTQKQIAVIALASAIASRYKPLTAAINEESAKHASAEELNGARAAAAIMGMNNVYYRALHLMKNQEYRTMPARLRMNVLANPGVDKANFELWATAVSAINGCGMCLDAHEEELRKRAVPTAKIQAALRIGAVVNAASRVLAAESALETVAA